MPVFTTPGVRPRAELAAAIVQGQNGVANMVGPKLLPGYGIDRRTAHIIKATIMDTLALRMMSDTFLRAPGTKFERAVAKFADDTFQTVIRGMEIVVPNEMQLDYAGYLDVERFFSARFGQTAMRTAEYLISGAAFNTSNFGSATNSTVAYTAANRATMDPIGDIIASARRVKAKGEAPDTVVMSGITWERVRTCLNVLQYVSGNLGAIRTIGPDTFLQVLAEYGIKQVLIGDSYLNTAADGATPVLVPLWSTQYIGVFTAGTPMSDADTDGIGVPSMGGIGAWIWWKDYTPDAGYLVESYESTEIDSVVVRVKQSGMPYIGNPNCGDLIATQYA